MIKSKKLIQKINRPPPDKSSRENDFRFDRNERTTLFSDDEFNSMISELKPYDFVAYGELEPFYNKLAKWLDISRNKILLTSGSDMAIRSVFETFIDFGDKVLITQPNYAMFSVYNKMYGGVECFHFYNEDLTLDLELLYKNLTRDIKLLIISNPGHTGMSVQENFLIKIIKKAESNKTLVLIDEAYFHFCKVTMIKYIDTYKNLIITRTFSKAIGLASLRIGLLIANESLIKELYKVKLVHEITGVAAKIGIYVLENFNIIDDYLNKVKEGKKVLSSRLSKIGLKIYKSNSNFFFFNMPKNTDYNHFMTFLKKKKIYIKGPFLNTPFKEQLRITIGDEKQMDMFCDIIEQYLK